MIEIDTYAVEGAAATASMVHGIASSLFDAAEGQHAAQSKPWTAWPVQSRSDNHLTLRFTWLADDVPLPAAVTAAGASSLRFHRQDVPVQNLSIKYISYAQVAAKPASAAHWKIQFHSPTHFSRDGHVNCLADPFLVLSSLSQRWNSFAGTELAIDSSPAALSRMIEIKGFDLRSEEWPGPKGQERRGTVGGMLWRIAQGDQTLRRHLATLLAAAEFLGVGKETTYGFGVVTAQPTSHRG